MAGSLYKAPDEYMLVAIQRMQDLGSRLTDFTAGSTTRTLHESLGAQLSLQSAVVEQLRQDSYLSTAGGEALDAKAADFQVTRKAAVAAAGTIRLTRATSGSAVSIPAGWGPLLTQPTPGQQPVAFISTEDAELDIGDLTVVVNGQAVEGGTAGNVAEDTVLLPQNGVPGFDTTSGFKAEIAFTGGVDEESDEQLRARVPIEVQGRVKGTVPAFLAAALRVPGVTSASVLEAGDTRESPGTGAVAANHVEVYYQGSSSLQAQVESEVAAARVAGQDVLVAQAQSVTVIIDLTVFCLAGTDHAALAAAVKATLIDVITAVGIDNVGYAAAIVKAVHDVPTVVSVNVPFQDLRKTTATDNTFGNIDCGNVAYPQITAGNITVTVTDL